MRRIETTRSIVEFSMSVQTQLIRHSVSKEEEDDEKFIEESTKLAKSFTELFISTLEETSGRQFIIRS